MAEWGTSSEVTMGEPAGTFATGDKPKENREKKINKKRLEELEANNKFLEIWTTDPKTGAKQKFCTVSLDCAAICCDTIFKAKLAAEKKDEKLKIFDLYCDTRSEMKAYQYVMVWVGRCGQERAIADVQDIAFKTQEDWQFLLDIIVAADKLEIPVASFGRQLFKKCKPLAQENLPDLDFVGKLFDSDDGVPELGAFAASVIFEAWYNWKLDAEEYDYYMARLQNMRVEKSALDEAIKAAVQDKDDHIKRMREKRRQQAEEDQGAQGGNFTNGDSGFSTGVDGGSDPWANQDAGTVGETQKWEMNGDSGSTNKPIWDGDNDGAAGDSGTVDWADDVNGAGSIGFIPVPESAPANW